MSLIQNFEWFKSYKDVHRVIESSEGPNLSLIPKVTNSRKLIAKIPKRNKGIRKNK